MAEADLDTVPHDRLVRFRGDDATTRQHLAAETKVLGVPAPVWARLGAAALDWAVLCLPLVCVALLGVRASRSGSVFLDLGSTIAFVLWSTGALLYLVLGVGEGQTLGMRALRIAVVDARSTRPIGYERALVRALLLLLLCLPCWIGLLPVLLDAGGRRRGWHDRVAGSVVVRGNLP